MKKFYWLAGLLLIVGVAFIYHYGIVSEVNDRAERKYKNPAPGEAVKSIHVNPLNDLVTIQMKRDRKAPLGVLGGVLTQNVTSRILEDQLNKKARADFDVYAMLVSYKVLIEFVEGASVGATKGTEPASLPVKKSYRIKVEEAYVRDGPSKKNIVTWFIKKGEVISPDRREGPWLHFSKDGSPGWVHGSNVE